MKKTDAKMMIFDIVNFQGIIQKTKKLVRGFLWKWLEMCAEVSWEVVRRYPLLAIV
jgi:hypothetical protein